MTWLHRCPSCSGAVFQLADDCPLCATREEDEVPVQQLLSRIRAVCAMRLDTEAASRPLLSPGSGRWSKLHLKKEKL